MSSCITCFENVGMSEDPGLTSENGSLASQQAKSSASTKCIKRIARRGLDSSIFELLLPSMKFMSATAAFFSVTALLCAVSAAPVAGDNELARRTSPGGGSYTGYFDPAEDTNVDNNDLSRRTSPGGGNYAGYFDPAEDTTAEGLYRRTSPGGGSYTGYLDPAESTDDEA